MLIFRQASVANTAVQLVTVPPGEAVVTLTASAAVYVGGSSAVTTANGAYVPANIPVTLPGFPGAAGTSIWGITGSTAATTVGIMISTTG